MPKFDSPGDTGVEQANLSGQEEQFLSRALQRGFEDTRTLDTRVILEKTLEYQEEIMDAAAAAKADFDMTFDGMSPESGSFGLDKIHSGYFGWNSWDNLGTVTGGQANVWLDGDNPDNLNSGVGGRDDPITVGNDAVHLILAVGDYAQSPVISRVRWRLNDSPRAAVSTEEEFRNTDLRLKWLDTPILLSGSDRMFAEVYASDDGNAAPYFHGVSFLKAQAYRNLDPALMVGADPQNILEGTP